MAPRAIAIVTAVALVALAARAHADQHLIRRLDSRDGVDVPWSSSLAQDARGFLWIGTPGGLLRYDGHDAQPWARAAIHLRVGAIRAAPDGSIYAIDARHVLWHVSGDVADAVPGASDVTDAQAIDGGALWVAAGGAIHVRDARGGWTMPYPELRGVTHLRRGASGAMWATSDRDIWRIDARGAARLGDGDGIVDLVEIDDGRGDNDAYALQNDGKVLAIGRGPPAVIFDGQSRGISLARRGRTIWVGFDRRLVALRPDRAPEVIEQSPTLPSAGPLLVDREGALWVATFQGLLQFPEPDTAILGVADGLPGGPRRLVANADGVWIGSWSGLGRIDRAGGSHDEGVLARAGVCVDRAGRLWTGDVDSAVVRDRDQFVHYPLPGADAPEGCAPAGDGGVWLTRGDGLYHALGLGAPVAVALPAVAGRVTAVYEDRGGRLWLARGDWGCFASARAAITPAAWTCRAFGGAEHVFAVIETDAGHIWAAADPIGVTQFDEAAQAWRALPGNAALPSRSILGLSPSPRGGVWIAGQGVLMRVLDRPELADGWQVAEVPSAWNGVFEDDGEGVLDEPDGTLWIAQNRGVERVAAAVRDQRPPVPDVTLVAATAAGRPVERGAELDADGDLELVFSALSFRDPRRVRYRFRVSPSGAWSSPTPDRALHLIDLAPGDYQLEIAATLDGVRWSATPLRFAFRIARPWYLRWWAIALALVAVAAALLAAHRVRLAMRLRLERLRTQIAMDLHDEMGSALGSIGLLAEMAGDREAADAERAEMVGDIADTAVDLSDALDDIVWSLRDGSGTLDCLIARVRERAERLFRGRVELRFAAPDVPAIPLSLGVRSNVQRVAFEALHNAARHAGARRVDIAFAADGSRWRMSIDDDGVGIAAGEHAGLGLTSMRRRADEIGAAYHVGASALGGARVVLVFDPAATP